ncbi:hypothetical protein N7G274_008895 [Stereocaulon virgatum]|uniref:Uncharacterized protein n=1 Tax=Stereocaulon virgatum TaxID=373712 RepID=A0ABR3ZZ20_9LECA
MGNQADEDKYTAIGCCIVSEPATSEENIPKELLELDMRTMARLRAPMMAVKEDE